VGYFQLNTGLIDNYSIELVNESADYRVINLSIYTDVSSVACGICADTRQPNIDDIYENLIIALEFAKTNADANIKINEYLDRKYIFMTHPDESIIQYTANII